MPVKALTSVLLALIWTSIGSTTHFQIKTDDPLKLLNSSEQALVEGSKRTILVNGISDDYFRLHFKLVRVVDKQSDRRVVWQFSINGYQAVISDSIGFYSEGTKRVDTHSIANSLGQTSEIRRTISRARALKILKTCIGRFTNPAVEYGAVNGQAQLLLVAQASQPPNEKAIPGETKRERQREQREKSNATTGYDVIKSDEKEADHQRVILGSVNLQTGKCTTGAGVIAP